MVAMMKKQRTYGGREKPATCNDFPSSHGVAPDKTAYTLQHVKGLSRFRANDWETPLFATPNEIKQFVLLRRFANLSLLQVWFFIVEMRRLKRFR